MSVNSTLLQRVAADPLSVAVSMALPSGQTVLARPLLSSDTARLGAYFESLSAETRSRFGPHPLDAAAAAQLCAEIDATRVLRWVAAADDEIVAYFILMWSVTTYEYERYATHNIALSGDVDCTFAPSVADRVQGQGLGSLMFAPMRRLAREAGRGRMVLLGGTQATNARAIAFYRKLGFIELARFEEPPGVWNLDMCLMC